MLLIFHYFKAVEPMEVTLGILTPDISQKTATDKARE